MLMQSKCLKKSCKASARLNSKTAQGSYVETNEFVTAMRILHKSDKILSAFKNIQGIGRRRIGRASRLRLEHTRRIVDSRSRDFPSGLRKMKEI